MREWTLKLLTRLVWTVALACLVGAIGGWTVAQALHIPQVDEVSAFRPAATTRVRGSDGSVVAEFSLERRFELRAEQIPDHLKLAIVAIEDADFYRHGGVDPSAVARAALVITRNIVSGRDRVVTQGGSTLTQQLARDLFHMKERTVQRKLKEMLLAIDIEKRLSKDQILTLYANQVYLGHGAYGVEAASRLYFDVPAAQLSLAQAALLAGMIQNPERLRNPISNPKGALSRRNQVLEAMHRHDFIDRIALDAALAEPLGASLHREGLGSGAYFVEAVRQELEERYGSDAVYTGGYEVLSTMDPLLQDAAQRAVREGLVRLDMRLGFRRPANVVEDRRAASAAAYTDPTWKGRELAPGDMVRAVVTAVEPGRAHLRAGQRELQLDSAGAAWTRRSDLGSMLRAGDLVLVRLPDPLPPDGTLQVELLQEPSIEGALLAMDNETGEVLALVGGFDFERSEFNRALQAQRQCGSAFKPFVFLTAFQQGLTPADTIFDAPILLPDERGELTYCPRNYYGRYYGISTLRRSLELSHNVTAVKLQQLVGAEAVIETAQRYGITSRLQPVPSLALGALEVSLVDLVRAYAGIANLGRPPEPMLITSVSDRDGAVRERAFPSTHTAMPAPIDHLMIEVLRGVVQRGTATKAAALPAHLAGKTGTTDDYTDAWFVGFSPRITVGVWVGRDRKAPIGRGMTGAEAALPIWVEFLQAYLDTLSEEERREDFPVPPGVVFSAVDLATGLRATPECGGTVILEAFLDGTEPDAVCTPDRDRLLELPWPLQTPFYQPRPGEPMPSPEAVACADSRIGE